MSEGPTTVVCGGCGSVEPMDNTLCSRCSRGLLVDLRVATGSLDPRASFAAARALTALGPPAPSFKAARQRFESRDRRVLEGVSAPFALRAARALEAVGVEARLEPHGVAGGRSRALLLAAAGLGVLAVGGLFLLRDLAPAAEPAPAPASGPADSASAESPLPAPPPGPEQPPLVLPEIGKQVLPAVVHISCEDHVGSGFFVDKNTILTNAHVACPQGKLQQVRLFDGRKLLGETLWRDTWKDLARVRVLGADEPPLPFGDVTLLSAGDEVAFVGSPHNLEFSLNAGKISYIGRDYLGLAYVQFDGSVNSGNSGGPLLDSRGRAIGVVSLKVADADGIGLALPTQYDQGKDAASEDPEARERWEAILARVEQEEQDKGGMFELGYDQPHLIGVTQIPGRGLGVILVERWSGAPHATVHKVELVREGTSVCEFKTSVEKWVPLEESTEHSEANRELAYRLRKEKGRDTHLGVGALNLGTCTRVTVTRAQGRYLRLEGDEEGTILVESKVYLALMQVVETEERVRQFEDKISLVKQHMRSRDEKYWREAFAAAYRRVDSVEKNIRDMKALVERFETSPSSGPTRPSQQRSYENAKAYLSHADDYLRAARRSLDDLESHASRRSVPREWRRRVY